MYDVPKTSRTRCDNVRNTSSPYEKVCVELQNIYDISKLTHKFVSCILLEMRIMYR